MIIKDIAGHQYLLIYKESTLDQETNKNIMRKIIGNQVLLVVGSVGCQPKGSKVLMANGEFKNIEDVKIGDKVISPQTDKLLLEGKVVWGCSWLCNKIYEVVDENDNVLYTCSYNHEIPFLTYKNGKPKINLQEAHTLPSLNLLKTYKLIDGKITEQIFKVRLCYGRSEKVFGLMIDTPSHFYVTNNNIITKNSGKSIAVNTMAYEYWKHGYTIVYLTQKDGAQWENAFCMFPVEEEYHLNILKKQETKPLTEERRPKVKFWHPFTFNVPDVTPNMNFFSFSLKDLPSEGFASLLAGEEDAQSVRTCVDHATNLKNTQSMWEFLQIVYKKIKAGGVTSYDYSPDNLFVPTGAVGDIRTVRRVKDSFKPFRQHFFLHEHNSKMNVNVLKILNNKGAWHYLMTNYLPYNATRLKYFTIISFLIQIDKALSSGKVKFPLLLVIEEVKHLLPSSAKTTYEQNLAEIIRQLLATLRSKGRGVTVILTTQSLFSINKIFRDGANKTLFGKLSSDDKQRLMEYLHYKTEEIEIIDSLKTGMFVDADELKEGVGTKMLMYMPPFAASEEHTDFVELYKQHYPNMMVDNTHLKKTMLEKRESFEEVAKKKMWDMEQEEIKQKNAKKQEKEQKKVEKEEKAQKELEKLKTLEKVKNIKKKEDKKKMAYELKKNENKTWVEIADLLNITNVTAKHYAMLYASKVVKDKEFVEKWV